MKKIFLLLITLLTVLPFSCRYNRVYRNREYRYTIKYPEGWIAVNSGHDKINEELFKAKVIEESPYYNFEGVDLAIYNPVFSGPIFESITVSAKQFRLNLKDLESNIVQLDNSLFFQLRDSFNQVRSEGYDVVKLKKGKILRFDYSFEHDGKKYMSSFFIIPGKLYATYFINGVTLKKNIAEFSENLNSVVQSFQKY